jgi:uncharacterized OsmC-like protein
MSTTEIGEALENITRVISEQPEKARARGNSATARLEGGLRMAVTGPNGESLHTDMPPALGGGATAPRPGWLLRAALASCASTVIAMRAAKLGISLDLLEVAVDSESDNRGMLGMDERVSAGMSAIRARVKLAAKGVSPEQLRELAAWGDAHSPVGCTVRNPPDFRVDVEIV